jgi:hypothetical protein
LKKTENRKKRKRKIKKNVLDDCKNPFHHLMLKSNARPIQGTCDCSVRIKHHERKVKIAIKEKEMIRITSLENKIPCFGQSRNHFQPDSGLDYKYGSVQLGIRNFFPTKTAADIAREEQDRKKRFKLNPIPSRGH